MSEIETVDAILKQTPLPEEVVDWRIEIGIDWTEEPSVFVYLLIDDAVWSREWSRKNASDLTSLVRHAIHDAEIGRWPYVSIRTVSEQREVEEEESKT